MRRMVSFAALLLALAAPGGLPGEPPPLAVHFLDVGQGEATLVQTPGGETILVDAGACAFASHRIDYGKTVVIPFLRSRKIHTLDMVVMSHPDADHIGGIRTILDSTMPGGIYMLKVKGLADSTTTHPTRLYQQILDLSRKRDELEYHQFACGESFDLGAGAWAEVLGPVRPHTDANNCSLVLRLRYGATSFLLTGDARKESEEGMDGRWGERLRSTVLKAPHHGSGESSSEPFLALVKPEVVIISVGAGNTYHLPSREALARLQATGARIFRTDYQGTISVSSDGKRCTVKPEKPYPPPEKRWDEAEKPLKGAKLVNINTASIEELEALPGIGPTKAKAVAAARPYASIDELLRAQGIGPKTLERLRPLITDGKPAEAARVTPIGDLSAGDAGKKTVTVEGEIGAVRVLAGEKGRIYRLDDESGAIDVLVWRDLYERLPGKEKLAQGARVRVRGAVDTYCGALEVKPSIPADVTIAP